MKHDNSMHTLNTIFLKINYSNSYFHTMVSEQLISDFFNEIEQILLHFPSFSDDDAFVYWYVNYLIGKEQESEDAITGIKNDKGIDAIWINDDSQTINILQGKFRKKWGKHNEVRNDLFALLTLIDVIWQENIRESFYEHLDPKIIKKLNKVIERVIERKYKINLYFITSGKVSNNLRKEIEHTAKRTRGNPTYSINDHAQLGIIFQDYLEGVAPAIQSYDLPIEFNLSSNNVGILNRNERQREIETWIFSISSQDVGKMVEKIGIKLFARNIRGFLGSKTNINEGMLYTIENEPENFWYYNNGITLVCYDATKHDRGGKSILSVSMPQIINGQQTARTLAIKSSPKASVLMKVIKIPREGKHNENYYDLVNNIVKATNWQNQIRYSDLVSNDTKQVSLEKNLRYMKYQYIRKRQKKSEAVGLLGFRPIMSITKERLAKCVAACLLDPTVLRLGPDVLFDSSKYYNQIFSSSDPDFYLTCYYLWKFEEHFSNNVPGKYYSYFPKWLILHFLWEYLSKTIKDGEGARRFRKLWNEKDTSAGKIFEQMIILCFKLTREFYDGTKKIGDREIDETTFYKQSDLWKNFTSFAKTKNSKEFKKFEKLVSDFEKNLQQIKLD